jgi:hypothetical protein
MRVTLADSEQGIEIAYEGEGVRDGSMDVRELAPALLSVGALFERANGVLNEESAATRVLVKSEFRAGSFHVDLIVLVNLAMAAKSVLLRDEVKTAREICEALGFLKSRTVGLLNLLKRLKGRNPESVKKLENGNVSMTIGTVNIQTVEITAPTYNLLRDDTVRETVKQIVEPIGTKGVSSMRIIERGDTIETIDEGDLPSFRPTLPDEADGDVLSDSTREAVVQIDRPSFVDKMAWTVSDGTTKFKVVQKDEEFAERIRSRKILFGAGDVLRVLLRSRTSRRADGVLRTVNEIVQVLDVVPAQRQYPLLPELDSE